MLFMFSVKSMFTAELLICWEPCWDSLSERGIPSGGLRRRPVHAHYVPGSTLLGGYNMLSRPHCSPRPWNLVLVNKEESFWNFMVELFRVVNDCNLPRLMWLYVRDLVVIILHDIIWSFCSSAEQNDETRNNFLAVLIYAHSEIYLQIKTYRHVFPIYVCLNIYIYIFIYSCHRNCTDQNLDV